MTALRRWNGVLSFFLCGGVGVDGQGLPDIWEFRLSVQQRAKSSSKGVYWGDGQWRCLYGGGDSVARPLFEGPLQQQLLQQQGSLSEVGSASRSTSGSGGGCGGTSSTCGLPCLMGSPADGLHRPRCSSMRLEAASADAGTGAAERMASLLLVCGGFKLPKDTGPLPSPNKRRAAAATSPGGARETPKEWTLARRGALLRRCRLFPEQLAMCFCVDSHHPQAVQLRLPAGESDSPGEEGSPVSQQEQLGGSQHMQVAAAATSHSTDTAEAGAAATSHSTDTAEARAAATRHSTDTAEARAAATRHSTDTAEARAAATRLSTDTAEAGAAAGEKPTEALASMTAAAGSASAGASAALVLSSSSAGSCCEIASQDDHEGVAHQSSNKVSSGNNNHRYKTTKRQSETSPFALSTWLQGVAAAVDGEPEDGEGMYLSKPFLQPVHSPKKPAEVAAEVTPAGGSVAHCGSTSAAFAAADTPRVASKADSSTTSLLQLLHHTSQWPYAALANPPTLTAASSEQRCGSSLTGEFTKPPGLLLEPDTPGSSRIPAGKSGGRLSFRLQKSPVDALHLRRCKALLMQQLEEGEELVLPPELQRQQQPPAVVARHHQDSDACTATAARGWGDFCGKEAPPTEYQEAPLGGEQGRQHQQGRALQRDDMGLLLERGLRLLLNLAADVQVDGERAAVKVAPAIQGARAAAASGDSRDAVSIAMLSFEEAAAALRGAKASRIRTGESLSSRCLSPRKGSGRMLCSRGRSNSCTLSCCSSHF
ncbi:hypothetical protein cyc_05807 [Cyclospora cayetanensis]|uniref:Uncharacterized protein n=1 Tax=Cyclospora cayetanensis TaxID=88456 RepID=A0A1D3CVL5_9EIME|nr:hypothetical protein cyc_05807 [Cyclospora cayetanensis]